MPNGVDLDKLEALLTGPLPDDAAAVLLAAAPELIAAARMLEELAAVVAPLIDRLGDAERTCFGRAPSGLSIDSAPLVAVRDIIRRRDVR